MVVMTTENGCVYRLSVDLVNDDAIEVIDNCLSGLFSPFFLFLPFLLIPTPFFMHSFTHIISYFSYLLMKSIIVQPSVTLSEFDSLQNIIMKNTSAVEAILDRGGDLDQTFCVPYSGLLFMSFSFNFFISNF